MDTVLIIETDTDTIGTLSELLSSNGYVADAVDDIEAARQKVAASSPKLIVIGPQLGKSTGFLACSLIKKAPHAKGIPCVLLYTEREEGQVLRHQSLAGRAEVYLRKPFGLDDFRAAVAEYLPLNPAGAKGGDEGEVVIEEELEDLKSQAGPPPTVEEVVEDVASVPPAVSAEAEAELGKLRGDVARMQRELEQAQKEAQTNREELKKSREEVRASRDAAPDAQADADRLRSDVTRLEKQLELAQKQAKEAVEAVAAAPAKGKSSSDTRQILELKQTLNKREAELVDFKETGLQKEKQVLELKGKLNDAEMKHVEFEDMIAERDREAASLKGQIDALTADKDVVSKRAEDLTRRLKTTEENLKRSKEEAESQRAAHDQALREKEEAHGLALEQVRRELTAVKDAERQEALDKLRGELSADKEAALGAVREEHEAASKSQQERHDTEIFEMQERFRRSMNQQEEKLSAEKAKAIDEIQQKHDGQVAELVTGHEREVETLRGEIATRDARIDELNALSEQHVAQIAKLGEERDELTRRHDALDSELKTSQVAAEHLRIELEKALERIAALEKELAETQGVRDQLRSKLEGDLARVDKTKQAVAVALELLNEVEPL